MASFQVSGVMLLFRREGHDKKCTVAPITPVNESTFQLQNYKKATVRLDFDYTWTYLPPVLVGIS